jgi:hypothetical protein
MSYGGSLCRGSSSLAFSLNVVLNLTVLCDYLSVIALFCVQLSFEEEALACRPLHLPFELRAGREMKRFRPNPH